MIKKIFVSVMVFSLINIYFPNYVKATTPDTSSVVQIMIWDNTTQQYIASGSGVIIGVLGEILTNFHVAEFMINQPKRYQAVVCVSVKVDSLADCSWTASPFSTMGFNTPAKYSEGLDLAILSISGKITSTGIKSVWEIPLMELSNSTPINIAQFDVSPSALNLKEGSYVQTLGYPADHADKLAYSEGNITGYEWNQYGDLLRVVISAKINHGSSGGGAFDANGNFLGITSGGWTDKQGKFIAGVIIPVTTVNWWLQDIHKGDIAPTISQTVINQALCLLDNRPKDSCPQPSPKLLVNSESIQTSNIIACQQQYPNSYYLGPDSNGKPQCQCYVGSTWGGQNGNSCMALATNSAPQVANTPNPGTYPIGTNIKTSDGTVSLIATDGTRRPYTSAGAFLSYGFNTWEKVVESGVFADLLLPVGTFIPPRNGTIFCATETKGTDVKGECALITGGKKAAFTSSAVFTGLGFSFDRAQNGDSSFLAKTTDIDNITDAHRPGVLVNNNNTVQLVGTSGNSMLGIKDINTFNSWGYSFADVVVANAADKALSQAGYIQTRQPGQLAPQ